ncbi:MAG: heme exporter protein CcmD [Gallionellaceae bacterium]|jgi:heme exporter protein D|nr:heme exporter protein CcmD [Gallionellaceae bacterium]
MSMSEFFSMGGRGFYVWGSYGAALLIFVVELVLVYHRRKAILQRLRLMRDTGDKE